MYRNFEEMKATIKKLGKPVSVSVAQANDESVLRAIKMASDEGFIHPILVGDRTEIEEICTRIGFDAPNIIHAEEDEIMYKATQEIHNGNASVLMKGLINTSVFMRGVLNREWGLREDKKTLLSLIAAYEHPKVDRLIFCADSGINAVVNYEKKEKILRASLGFMQDIGYNKVNVALLTANELYDPAIEASEHAKALSELDFSFVAPMQVVAEGPISLDIAFDKEIAEHKGFASQIAGEVDFLLFPNMEAGNFLGKSWLYFDEALWASVVLGAKVPIILGSRSDTTNVKVNSIVMGCLAGAGKS